MASLPDRPKSLTEEKQAAILDNMALGMHFSPACWAAGIHPDAVKYWQRLLNDGAEHAQVFADFFAKLEQAPALAEREALSRLKQGEGGWQAQGWFLERRFRKRWGKSAKPESAATSSKGDVIEVRLVEDTPIVDTDG